MKETRKNSCGREIWQITQWMGWRKKGSAHGTHGTHGNGTSKSVWQPESILACVISFICFGKKTIEENVEREREWANEIDGAAALCECELEEGKRCTEWDIQRSVSNHLKTNKQSKEKHWKIIILIIIRIPNGNGRKRMTAILLCLVSTIVSCFPVKIFFQLHVLSFISLAFSSSSLPFCSKSAFIRLSFFRIAFLLQAISFSLSVSRRSPSSLSLIVSPALYFLLLDLLLCFSFHLLHFFSPSFCWDFDIEQKKKRFSCHATRIVWFIRSKWKISG